MVSQSLTLQVPWLGIEVFEDVHTVPVMLKVLSSVWSYGYGIFTGSALSLSESFEDLQIKHGAPPQTGFRSR